MDDRVIKRIKAIIIKVLSKYRDANLTLRSTNCNKTDDISIIGVDHAEDTFDISFHNAVDSVKDVLCIEDDNVYTVNATALAEAIYIYDYSIYLDGKYNIAEFSAFQGLLYDIVSDNYLYGLERFLFEVVDDDEDPGYDDDDELLVTPINYHYVNKIKNSKDDSKLTYGLYRIAAALDYELDRSLGFLAFIGPTGREDPNCDIMTVTKINNDGEYRVETHGQNAENILSIASRNCTKEGYCYLYDIAKAIERFDLYADISLND
jgi:hypothetical protein